MKRLWLYCLLLSLLVNGSIHLMGGVEQTKDRLHKIVLNENSLRDYLPTPLQFINTQTTFRLLDSDKLVDIEPLKTPNMDNFIIGYADTRK